MKKSTRRKQQQPQRRWSTRRKQQQQQRPPSVGTRSYLSRCFIGHMCLYRGAVRSGSDDGHPAASLVVRHGLVMRHGLVALTPGNKDAPQLGLSFETATAVQITSCTNDLRALGTQTLGDPSTILQSAAQNPAFLRRERQGIAALHTLHCFYSCYWH